MIYFLHFFQTRIWIQTIDEQKFRQKNYYFFELKKTKQKMSKIIELKNRLKNI